MVDKMKETMMETVEQFCDTLDLLEEPMKRVFSFFESMLTQAAEVKANYHHIRQQQQVARVALLAQALDGKSEAAIAATYRIILGEMELDGQRSKEMMSMAMQLMPAMLQFMPEESI